MASSRTAASGAFSRKQRNSSFSTWRTATAARQSDAVVAVSCGEVMTLTLFLARGLDGLGFHGDAAGHDEHAHAFADGDVLDVPAVADDDAAVFRREIFQPRGEGFQAHRADHQDQFLFALRVEAHHELAVERMRQVGQRRQHLARILCRDGDSGSPPERETCSA